MKRIDIAIVHGYGCVSQIHVTNTFPKWPYDFLKKCLQIKKKKKNHTDHKNGSCM